MAAAKICFLINKLLYGLWAANPGLVRAYGMAGGASEFRFHQHRQTEALLIAMCLSTVFTGVKVLGFNCLAYAGPLSGYLRAEFTHIKQNAILLGGFLRIFFCFHDSSPLDEIKMLKKIFFVHSFLLV